MEEGGTEVEVTAGGGGGGGLHLRVAAEQWVPWLRITKVEETGRLTYSGIMHNILLALSSSMNFT